MAKKMLRWLILLGLLLAALASPAAAAQTDSAPVVTVRFEGALHPVMLEYFDRAAQIAEREGAQAIIIELDTPGGEITLMEQIVQSIRASQVPVIIYVSPRGAMAGSAGTLVTLAGHVAAMAPETTIGAASPVGSEGEDLGETMASKIKGAMKALVRSLAADRPADAVKMAEDMIDRGTAVSSVEALDIGLIDIIARDQADLLRQLDSREVKIDDETIVLSTAGARVQDVPLTFLEELLLVLANPNIVFLLLAVGVQAVLIEISTPGGWIAGFIGVVCLLLATYGMGLLPVNWFGMLFLVMSFVLFILDIKAPTHGALTVAGVASFIVGALVLFNSPNVPSFQRVSVPLVIGTGIGLGLMFFGILLFALRAQRAPVITGRESLIGQTGIVTTPLNPVGTVQLGSELWTAVIETGSPPAVKGDQVEVVKFDRLQIIVRKVNK